MQSHQLALHLAVLVDSLLFGDYTSDWRGNIVSAFIAFREEVAEARQRHRTAHETSPCYERFVALLGGSRSTPCPGRQSPASRHAGRPLWLDTFFRERKHDGAE